MTSIRKAVVTSLRASASIFGAKNGRRLRRVLSEALGLEFATIECANTEYGAVRYFSPNDLTRWRAETLFTKEPETLEWIDSFAPGEVLWDVGANVGLYTVYAGLRGARVVAFEPGGANYYVLNRNIKLNDLDEAVDAYCVALAAGTCAGHLLLSELEIGSACNSFNEEITLNGAPLKTSMRQGMIGYSIDDFIRFFEVPFPNHLKIDVDGIEGQIIAGASDTLRDPRLKSISIELDVGQSGHADPVIAAIEANGFTLISRRHAPMFEGTIYSSLYNYRFGRSV